MKFKKNLAREDGMKGHRSFRETIMAYYSKTGFKISRILQIFQKNVGKNGIKKGRLDQLTLPLTHDKN
ncbi:hypothetical protein KSH_06980 [Moraxella osloensis]|nr:hypothetical protein KSH_06980 [Moraxella osloensis]